MAKYLVQGIGTAKTKRGKEYLRFTLVEVGGKQWPGVCWEPPATVPVNGNVVDALVEEGEFMGTKQLDVKAMRVVAEKPTSDEFLPRAKNDPATLMAELKGYIDSVTDPGIKKVLTLAVADPRWLRAPAAQSIHHAYLGGLLEHTVNLCRLVNAISPLYPKLRRDLLIAGAVLHDCGKMSEMSCETNIDYTNEGKLIGHIVIGFEWLIGWMEEANLPDETRLLLKHMVLSHHGQAAYGSPKSPQIIEAQAFSKMDGLDAEMGAALAAIEKSDGKEWTDRPSRGEALYIGVKR
jgi:3'-5' exoribonuclease